MKKLLLSLILYIAMLLGLQISFTQSAHAIVSCQVTYGGGQVCQGQALMQFTYPAPIVQPVSNPTPTPLAMPFTHRLPATGASELSYILIALAAVAGIAIHLFL